MSDLKQRIANLPPEQRAHFEAQLLARLAAIGSATIPRRANADVAPLSFSQERLWFLDQLHPGLTAYNECNAQHLAGQLDVDALQRSLNEIVRRHESLRTTFHMRAGEPVQVINPPRPLPLTRVDLRRLPQDAREAAVRQYADNETQRPFDLTRDLTRRATLLCFGEEEHVLLLGHHHISSDAWSSGVFWRELMTLYAAFSQGSQAALPDLPIQYADYAAWQRAQLQNETLQRLLGYWKQRLDGVPSLLQLPTDFPRPANMAYQGERIPFILSSELTNALRSLSKETNATIFMTLLAAFQTLLHRFTGGNDILVGAPVANRPLPELEPLIGFFINTLPLRADLSGNPTFLDVLRQARQLVLEGIDHQALPFARMVEELQVERSLAYSPLVQVIFSVQNIARAEVRLPRLQVAPLTLPSQNVHFDLHMILRESGEQLQGICIYRTDLFAASTIRRFIAAFETLLTDAAANPARPIAELDLLGADERRRLLVEWNATAQQFDRRGLHQAFEDQAQRTPQATAVVDSKQTLTYRQLNERANRLAHFLIAAGLRPEAPVALCVERSCEMAVSVLAILKAGGAYAPLEPTTPPERLRMMCDELGAELVITQAALAAHFEHPARQVVVIDAEQQKLASFHTQNPELCIHPERLAYVLFTSGSTGKPKGVMIEHRQIMNYVASVLGAVVPAASSCAMLQPLTVDSCLTMLFPPLVSGGALHLLSQEQALDGLALGRYFRDHAIDCLKIAPSHLAALCAVADPALLMPRLRLILGGEASRWEWVESLRRAAPPGCQVFNHYGPTETTVGVLTHPFSGIGAFASNAAPLMTPLGRPLANTQVYILDRLLQPAPVGVEGELFIGGENVGRGYLGQPGLTAERFVPSPFGPGRLYRTGDRARFLGDGAVEFLGRFDDQVKIRGFRVELGEIEAELALHPAVRMAVVNPFRVNGDEQQLAAYVVLDQGETQTADAEALLRPFLEERLPEYMLPAAYVALDALPRTAHGKLNRRQLPPPAAHHLGKSRFIAPATPVEAEIAAIWRDVLGVERVGVDENFFRLGGHSLLAVRVIARIRSAFRIDLPVRALFESPTVRALAEDIEARRLAHILQDNPSALENEREVMTL